MTLPYIGVEINEAINYNLELFTKSSFFPFTNVLY